MSKKYFYDSLVNAYLSLIQNVNFKMTSLSWLVCKNVFKSLRGKKYIFVYFQLNKLSNMSNTVTFTV